ncbi:hypothetical protein FH972_021933 [Carpinus fangiana]|uniref:Uncharacterized protein n=1 Tax=Carpinus fangiana TaxID=176857 RepID=A0A5N6KRE6_9ROSI|nr:hypothetical protein FH972_021933 [Carpinus fangiana]
MPTLQSNLRRTFHALTNNALSSWIHGDFQHAKWLSGECLTQPELPLLLRARLLLLLAQCDADTAEWCIHDALRVCDLMADALVAAANECSRLPDFRCVNRIRLRAATLAFRVAARKTRKKHAEVPHATIPESEKDNKKAGMSSAVRRVSKTPSDDRQEMGGQIDFERKALAMSSTYPLLDLHPVIESTLPKEVGLAS